MLKDPTADTTETCDVYVSTSNPYRTLEDPKFLPSLLFLHTVLLSSSLKMMHPIMPFISEELPKDYQRCLPSEEGEHMLDSPGWWSGGSWNPRPLGPRRGCPHDGLRVAGIQSNYTR